ncbi:MAG TPA: type II toxin-antitoxin system RelE/ParE family toxin [Candidatus Paceibacterota bacterium]|nr:type II toxin-antitoxin system RelE/ParE family toxin [Candidatus Pacearchaeota archaeon]HRZ51343.1 type II toxin-antitoxin system RelE/ParE family toxin [Candidatus Paceibacterota bacterium]HSA37065.1 type II toxin-antitoxin system RelE/ParE family toxin [Candidatus Paceibacterota bacterium]
MLLEIVRYRSKFGHVPFNAYVEKYAPSSSDKNKTSEKKVKTLLKIKAVIKIVADKGGIGVGDYTSALKGYDVQEITIKKSGRAIRLLYFCRFGKLVLLNGFDKGVPYEGGKGKKTEKMIEEKYREGQQYYQDFIKNPGNYEEFD